MSIRLDCYESRVDANITLQGIDVVKLDGRMSFEARDKYIQRFTADASTRVFLISLKVHPPPNKTQPQPPPNRKPSTLDPTADASARIFLVSLKVHPEARARVSPRQAGVVALYPYPSTHTPQPLLLNPYPSTQFIHCLIPQPLNPNRTDPRLQPLRPES